MANTIGKKFGGREKGTPNKLTAELRFMESREVENGINE